MKVSKTSIERAYEKLLEEAISCQSRRRVLWMSSRRMFNCVRRCWRRAARKDEKNHYDDFRSQRQWMSAHLI